MTILPGDCLEVLKTLPDNSVDLTLTDPPYFVAYRDRYGRRVKNDGANDMAKVLTAFTDVYRVMKPDTLCISFYGWQAIDAFMAAWKAAGFTPVEHIVWRKPYASSKRFCERRHEQAYVLAKGRPDKPRAALPDVQPWHYSGNRYHPTEKSVDVLKPVIEAFTAPGETVLDPFAGSGSTLAAAAMLRRKYIGIELEEKYCRHIERRLKGVERWLSP